MALCEHVKVARRFQRSVRIDTDLGDQNALQGFVCPKSSADVLLSMSRHISETGQGAFTWTGPYGCGKSSLVVALSALLNGNKKLQKEAAKAIGEIHAKSIWEALPPRSKGWKILPVVGRRDNPVQVLGEALTVSGLKPGASSIQWTEKNLVETLTDIASQNPHNHGGVVVFIDEMGKFLEAAAQDNSDVYVFQQLAEAASRSNGRLIIVGILHQSFEEYATRLSRDLRDEWSKIQGRFIDLSVNTAGEEQIDLLSRAILFDSQPKNNHAKLSNSVAKHIHARRPAVSKCLSDTLEGCWPLHPVVAALLGPISRRRFGQNQRSIFGFLNSAEPQGFQDFLHHATEKEIYEPARLWEYLRANLEPSILASPDGHRWALAAEVIERCESIGSDEIHLRLLKTIAVIDLFKERSGLVPSVDILAACIPDFSKKNIESALSQLKDWSFVIFKKFLDAYAVYAGSDFDIDKAVGETLEDSSEIDFMALKSIAGLQPILAKRHYHKTGALRWFDVDIAPLKDFVDGSELFSSKAGTIGRFLLAIPSETETDETARGLCRKAARKSDEWDVVVGLSQRAWLITDLARELLALERVSNERSELVGDAVARQEVGARLANLQVQLETELHRAFDNADWYQKNHKPERLLHDELNSLASDIADKHFSAAPILHNELLNRLKPSSSAVAAQNNLLRAMVLNEGEPRLGIEGYPAEGGLFSSLLEATGLYKEVDDGWRFVAPNEGGDDPCYLAEAWDAGTVLLQKNDSRTVQLSELYELWQQPPFGIKDGMLPLLAVAFVLSQRNNIAFYRQGIFQARFKDLDIDYLVKDASDIQLRWMDLTDVSRRLLSGMAEIVRSLEKTNTLTHLEPIDVARGLISIYESLQPWTKRTTRLSANAIRVRSLFRKANDPNKFLFDDLPSEALGAKVDLAKGAGLAELIESVRDGLEELVGAYPNMLARFGDNMLAELQVPNSSPQALLDLRERAENIKQLAGDFKLDAFVGRIAQFSGQAVDVEGVASLAASKPPRDWVDNDLDRAALEVTDFAQKFNRAEAFARVKGRPDKRHAMAVVVGINGRPTPIIQEFDITDADSKVVGALVERVESVLSESKYVQTNIILATLAHLSAHYMQPRMREKKRKRGLRPDAS